VPEFWRKEEKLAWLDKRETVLENLSPDASHTWLVPSGAAEFQGLVPVAEILTLHSRGIATCRDGVVYDFQSEPLAERVQGFVEDYNAEVDRYRRAGAGTDVDQFVRYDRIKWSETLKLNLRRGVYAAFERTRIRPCLYRPFTMRFVYFDRGVVERLYQFPRMFPQCEADNRLIWLKVGSEWPMFALAAKSVVDLLPQGGSQCFPFYTYSPDGSNRCENITDAALEKFRSHYRNPAIAKWDIFHYIYAVLHHPAYREKFADNLKRELPRIPFAPDFAAFAAAGRELARLHVEYETLEPWPLEWVENPAYPLSYRVEDKMRLNKDKTALAVNPSLTLAGIPPETFEYRLGNRSALEWVVDQYRVTEDERSGIKSDPNREDDPQYIVRLVGQVVRVSIETVRIVGSLPPVFPG
jgi:predicted helicase